MKARRILLGCFLFLFCSLPFGSREGGLFAQTWTGGYSVDWNNPCNWNNYFVPSCSDNVIIPGGTPYQPTIGAGQTGYCATISINSSAGAGITINSGSGGVLYVGCTSTPTSCPSPCTMTIYPVADTRVRAQGYQSINYGPDGYMSTETNSGNGPWIDICMMRFPLTAIPSGATITAASLHIYQFPTSASGSGPGVCGYDQAINVSAYQFADITWVENTVTWWTKPAGLPGTVQSTLTLNSTPGFKTFPVVVATLQSNLAAGAISYSLQGADFSGSSGKCYATKESCTASEYLVVTFTY